MKYRSKMVALISFAEALILSGCATGSDSPNNFSNADLMFAEMMIPHHEQAIAMAELALSKSNNPKVLTFAEQIKGAQAPEIDQMQKWLDSQESNHMGHDMMDDSEGSDHGMMEMLDESEISELEGATGVEFDRLFLTGMIAHHEGAIDMAEMVVDSDNEEAAALGKAIIEAQRAEITEMRALLATLA